MKRWKQCFTLCLCLVMLLGLVPASASICVQAATGDLPPKRAVSVSDISVPSYSGGTSSSWMTYDGGLGMALGDTGAESKMRIVTGTTSSQYSTYRDLLKSKGYTVL